MGVIYDDDGIDDFIKEVKKLKQKIIVYVFSLDDGVKSEDFDDIKNLVHLKPIPSAILNIYNRILK